MKKTKFICIAGKNNIAVDVLDYLIKNYCDKENVGIICNKTERGVNGWQRSLRLFAEVNEIREYKLEEVYSISNLIFISLEFDQIVRPERFAPDARLYNIHFSLLPQYKGMYTSTLPILNGEEYVGVTFHKIDRGIDTGDIIKQKKFILKNTCTSRELYFQYLKYGTELVLECMEDVIDNKIKAFPQPMAGSTYYSKKALDYNNLEIDLNQTACGIDRQIRAYSFREYQLPEVYGRSIISSRLTTVRSKEKPGTVLLQNGQGMVLATVDYDIMLYFDRFHEVMKACREGDLQTVMEICTVPEHINAADERGWTPLIVATYNGYEKIVNYLILNGADIHARNNNGTTLLMYAKDAWCDKKNKNIFKTYVKLGLSAKECDYNGKNLHDYLPKEKEEEINEMEEMINGR